MVHEYAWREQLGVKNEPMPTLAAWMRSARLPWGTTSSSILPARYKPSKTCASGWSGKLPMI